MDVPLLEAAELSRRADWLNAPRIQLPTLHESLRIQDAAYPTIFGKVERLPDFAQRRRYRLTASRLPLISPDGRDILPEWKPSAARFVTGLNCGLYAEVEGTAVTVESQGKASTWNPELTVGGKPYTPKGPLTITDDPENENYRANCLSFDYGICERRIRIIEGRLREWWIFTTNPKAEIRIRHNLHGSLPIKLGGIQNDGAPQDVLACSVEGDVEVFTPPPNLVGPFRTGASATYYPDNNPETSTVDGYTRVYNKNMDWADLIAEPGDSAGDDSTAAALFRYGTAASTDKWSQLYRSIFLFDSSGIPDGDQIDAATLRIRMQTGSDSTGISWLINVFSSNPASNTALAAGDFDSLGSTPYATGVADGDLAASESFQEWTLNAAGRAAISKTGITKLGIQDETYDAGETEPTWPGTSRTIYQSCYFAEQGAGYKPELVVTYSTPEAGGVRRPSGAGSPVGPVF